MKISRYATSALLGVLATALTMGIVALPAQATSSYDDTLHATSTLEVYTDGATKSQTMDISASWWTDFKQTYAKRVAQNIGWPSNFVEKFENIMQAGGSWGVYTTEDAEGKLITIAGTEDPDATCSLQTSGGIDFFDCMVAPGYESVRAQYFTHNSYGGNGCWGSYVWRCSDNGMNVYQAPDIFGSTSTSSYAVISMGGSGLANSEFFVMNFNIDYPSGYEGDVLWSQEVLNLVALGDSFSSGEGVEPYAAETDTSGPTENRCHRSDGAYPNILDELDYGRVAFSLSNFAACSGATTSNIVDIGQWNEQPQINAITPSTDVITLTIGGNDLGFAEAARRCAHNSPFKEGWGCSLDYNLSESLQARLDALDGYGTAHNSAGGEIYPLADVLTSIYGEAPNATIYVGGYPHLFGSNIQDYASTPSAPGYASCVVGIGVSYSYNDAQWINEWTDSLNQVIQNAVIDARAAGASVSYVEPSGFAEHGLCDSSVAYIYGVTVVSFAPIEVSPNSLHPTVDGILYGYAESMEDAMIE